MKRKHYYLFTTKVMAVKLEDQALINVDINIVFTAENKTINTNALGQVQHQAQVRYMTQYDDQQLTKVADVIIANISYLGHMDGKEFYGDKYVEPVEAPAPKTNAVVPEGANIYDGR